MHEDRADGTVDLAFEVAPLLEITEWILTWGDTVEVLEPVELRDRMTAVALGMAPNPMTNKTEVQPELGKHAIDTLGILQAKTKGNLTGEEAQLLEAVLHQLRMAYLQVKK